jgi:hypothetical protein
MEDSKRKVNVPVGDSNRKQIREDRSTNRLVINKERPAGKPDKPKPSK